MRVIVTGANGFTGKYLMRELMRHGIRSIGIWHANQPGVQGECEWARLDLTNRDACSSLIHRLQPDAIVHLAAQSSVVASKDHPVQTIEDNVIGTVNLLEAVRTSGSDIRCILAGTAAVYDASACNAGITEESPVKCNHMYALTKRIQEQIAERYRIDYGMEILCTRPFNYTGYLQGEHCFIPSLCRQVSDIKKGKKEPILTLGNLKVSRDFSDVRDVARAYRLLLNKNVPCGIYNIASGKAVRLMDIVRYLCEKAKLEITIDVNPALVRKDDIESICGNADKIKSETGWESSCSIFDTADWIYTSMQEEDQ